MAGHMARKAKKPPQSRTTSRESEQFLLRLPDGMREHLAETAQRHGRSMNAEIVTALAMYFAESTLGKPVKEWAPPEKMPEAYDLLLDLQKTVEHLSKQVEKLGWNETTQSDTIRRLREIAQATEQVTGGPTIDQIADALEQAGRCRRGSPSRRPQSKAI
jgi:hypothetical protein